jgi:predicted CXXCH cytochrome family protein
VQKLTQIWIVLILIINSFLFSCSPRASRNILTFFFDGVPPIDTIPSDTSVKKTVEISTAEEFSATPFALDADYIIHYPYKEKECLSCHDENSKSEIIMPQPQLCYTCHDDFSTIYKKVHGPVAGGYCTSCHNPHLSKEKKLLIRTGQQLCLYCHDSNAVLANEVHKDISDSDCTMCHNPHGGEDRFILN